MKEEDLFSLIIVDDEKLIREGLNNYIGWNSFGFKVVGCFEDGQEAVDYVLNNPVDVILTDIKMANLSGLELAEVILLKGIKTKIILMSGYKDFNYAKKAIKLKVHDYLLKPIEFDTIKEVFSAIYDQLALNSEVSQPEKIEISSSEHSELVIKKAVNFMNGNYQKDLSLDDVADHVYLSPVYFCRFFKESTNTNFLTFLTNLRMGKAGELLKERKYKISEVSLMVGYKNAKYFAKLFKKFYGMVPSEFLRREFSLES